jgi:hypothetical protein
MLRFEQNGLGSQTVYRPKAKVAGVSQLEKKTDIFVTIL